MQLTSDKTIALIASAALIIPLGITALALMLVSITSLTMPDARRQHALLVLDRLAVFAFALPGRARAVKVMALARAQDGPHCDQAR